MSLNMTFAHNILQRLLDQGVELFCLCPGARNAPFVALLADNPQIQTLSFYDERSASFFALGRAKASRRPVVVVTTSGTAVSELLSATIEAWHVQVPLILLTADRPRPYRGTGSPQTIVQHDLFSGFVDQAYDLTPGETLPPMQVGRAPVHINVCFDEPLLDGPIRSLNMATQADPTHHKGPSEQKALSPQLRSTPPPDRWWSQFSQLKRPVVVVGGLAPEARQPVMAWLQALQVPFFVETLSGLKGELADHPCHLQAGDPGLCRGLNQESFGSVLRVGDIPVGRFWRDLEKASLPVLHLNDKDLVGLTHGEIWQTDLATLSWSDLQIPSWACQTLLLESQKMRAVILDDLQKQSDSELAWFAKLAQWIPQSATVYLGNSLPVREWEAIAPPHAEVFASRGVNGIDGQLSTALGLLSPERPELWVILGDLTTLYDFSGFWLTPWLRQQNFRVGLVVINNRGGQIFAKMFSQQLFLNSHNLHFAPLAEMWGWEYKRVSAPEHRPNCQAPLTLLEINPNPPANLLQSGHTLTSSSRGPA